jgi:long-chain fatty acid transport protein
MSVRCVKPVIGVCSAFGTLLAATIGANAGGFAVREQSAYSQGASFAGAAAGGTVSSQFWNPATMTQMPGIQSDFSVSGIIPYSVNSPTSGTLLALGLGGTDNIANSSLAPSAYFSWQVNPQLWLGLAVNAPYGLAEGFPDMWAGRNYAASSSYLKTYDTTVSTAYAINEWISIGIGAQFQYADAKLTKGFALTPTSQLALDGTGWGYGFIAGVTVTPTPTTKIGIGYRSGIDQKINGTLALPAGVFFSPPFSTPGSVSTTIHLPDVVSLGIRQMLSPQWTVMGTVEWSNWSRIGTAIVTQPSGAPALVLSGPGLPGGAATVPFEYKDGWLFSIGAEYLWNDQLTLRAGVGYEQSPITDQVRVPLVPDNDRTWLSAGATVNLTNALSFDMAYSHLFVKATPINIAPGNPSFNGAVTYIGTVDSHVDIFSLELKYRWDDATSSVKPKL